MKLPTASRPDGLRAVAVLAAVLLAAQLAATAAAEDRDLVVWLTADGRAEGTAEGTIKVAEGDEVTLQVFSEHHMHMHLHGYDLEAEAGPDVPAEFSFTASVAGRFPVSRHGGDGGEQVLLYIEVWPR